MFHNILAGGKFTLDGYDIMADNQNLYAAFDQDFHFRNHSVGTCLLRERVQMLCSTFTFRCVNATFVMTLLLMAFHGSFFHVNMQMVSHRQRVVAFRGVRNITAQSYYRL